MGHIKTRPRAGEPSNNPTGGEPHPHNQAAVLEVLRGSSNLRRILEKCVAFFLSFSFGFARNCGDGKIVPAFWSTLEGFRAEIADVCF